MAKYEWASRLRNYEHERKLCSLPSEVTTQDHPLKYSSIPVVTNLLLKSNPNSRGGTPRAATPNNSRPFEDAVASPLSSSDLLDPLSQLSVEDPLNPTSSSRRTPESVVIDDEVEDSSSSTSKPSSELLGIDGFEPWSAKRSAILSKFTTFEKLTIASSFFSDDAVDSDKLAAKKDAAPQYQTPTTSSPTTTGRERGFVGYLEEQAVITYTHILQEMDEGRLPMWAALPAPSIAVSYWQLPTTAKMRDVILVIRADEAHHRLVNHTLGRMDLRKKNPFKPGE